VGRVDREVHAFPRKALTPVARHGVGVVERPRLLEVHTEAPTGEIERRQPTVVIELLDHPDGPVRDVE
jgi:hypothetical protein